MLNLSQLQIYSSPYRHYPTFRDCRNLNFRIRLWLVRASVPFPSVVISAEKSRGWSIFMTLRLQFSLDFDVHGLPYRESKHFVKKDTSMACFHAHGTGLLWRTRTAYDVQGPQNGPKLKLFLVVFQNQNTKWKKTFALT